jgi:hypothetical protein
VLGWDRSKDAEMMEAAELPDPNDRPPTEARENAEFDVSSDFGVYGRPPSLLLDVLARNSDAFTFDGKPGLVSGMEMTLDTDDEKLVPERLRQMSPAKKAITDDTMDHLLGWDLIEELDSRLSFPVVIVKQNGKYRFCVDYRNLNRFTKPTIYPMQRSDVMFEALAVSQYPATSTQHADTIRLKLQTRTGGKRLFSPTAGCIITNACLSA